MTRIRGVDTRPDTREGEKTVPPTTADHGAEELHICALGSSAKRIDKCSDRSKEFRVEFIDWCEGISDPPNGVESFEEVLLYGEYLSLLKLSQSCDAWVQIRTL